MLIDITKNAQFEEISVEPAQIARRHTVTRTGVIDLSGLKEAAALINGAKRPMLLVGHGVLISGAEAELRAVSEKSGIPVASTLLGLSAFPTEHPLYVRLASPACGLKETAVTCTCSLSLRRLRPA